MDTRQAISSPPGSDYQRLREDFSWRIPSDVNIGAACADHQNPASVALIQVQGANATTYTFGDVTVLSNRLANAFLGLGVGAGDRVGIVMPQRLEVGLTHLALYKLGAIALPLSGLFGIDALEYRLADSGARAVVTDRQNLEKVAEVAAGLGGVAVVCVDDPVHSPHQSFWNRVRAADASFSPQPVTADTPALLIYTSGTTGPPKGALHGHRVLWGHLPGYELMYDFFPQPHDVVWTPADWAWIGGLMDALLPSWYHGRPVLAAPRVRFDPEWAVDLIETHGVTASFLPPTALKMMREAGVNASGTSLRAVMSGGEPLGAEMLHWGKANLGVTINEIYGQTEVNLVVGNCSTSWDVRPGSMGRAYPGFDVAILDSEGVPLPSGETGEIAVRGPNPCMFLEYWKQPELTADKYAGEWLLTGDLAQMDEDGYLRFQARSDDVITSAGFRIGPGEVEECLIGHPAVAMAAAIGVPDAIRGHVVKAFVVPAAGSPGSPSLARELQELVRNRLGAHEYPRTVEFVRELPLTTTGKIMRAELRRREAASGGG